jgi:Bacterial regulatory proteins, luxR family
MARRPCGGTWLSGMANDNTTVRHGITDRIDPLANAMRASRPCGASTHERGGDRAPRAAPRKAIGRSLFISERTVAQHLTAIFHKLGANTRAQAAAVATQCGLR